MALYEFIVLVVMRLIGAAVCDRGSKLSLDGEGFDSPNGLNRNQTGERF